MTEEQVSVLALKQICTDWLEEKKKKPKNSKTTKIPLDTEDGQMRY